MPVSRRLAKDPAGDSSPTRPDEHDVASLGALAVSGDRSALVALIDETDPAKRSVETLLLDVIAPAAHWLEGEWRAGRRTFDEVSRALDLLADLVAVLAPSPSPGFPGGAEPAFGARPDARPAGRARRSPRPSRRLAKRALR